MFTWLHGAGQDSELAFVGAISGQKVEAVVNVEGQATVVVGGHLGLFNLADGGSGAADQMLGGQLQVADAGLHGEDEVQWVWDADLREGDFLFATVDGQVEAGGFAVELDAGQHLLSVVGFLLGGGLPLVLDVGPEGDLQQLGDLVLDLLDLFINVVVFNLEFDFIDGPKTQEWFFTQDEPLKIIYHRPLSFKNYCVNEDKNLRRRTVLRKVSKVS